MKINLTGGQIVGIGVVGLAAVTVFRAARATGRAVGAAAQAVNPANNNNIINRGFNDIIGATDKGTSLGSIIFDFFNPEFDPNEPVKVENRIKLAPPINRFGSSDTIQGPLS